MTQEIDLVHFPLGVIVPEVAVVLDHFGVDMAQPFPNLALGRPAQKRLAAEEVAEAVQPAMFEADFSNRCRELFFGSSD